jgi:CBS domain-containing protein
MQEKNISSVIIEEDRKVAGIITERDIVHAFVKNLDPATKVEDVMTKNPITIPVTETDKNLKKIMIKHNFRHLPVVDAQKNIIGIISLRDLVRMCDDWIN